MLESVRTELANGATLAQGMGGVCGADPAPLECRGGHRGSKTVILSKPSLFFVQVCNGADNCKDASDER